MKITTRNFNRFLGTICNRTAHNVSYSTKPENIPAGRKTVIVSTSHDIYENLALENWIYKNKEYLNDHLLMLWTNEPCVVIGRHQNPWAEADVFRLKDLGVQLARRNSGGGTVYHDRGNLNLTFFAPLKHYNRKHNLQFIAEAVQKHFGVTLDISAKEDLLLREFKVSGTAAKLGRYSYHHCTLLVKADIETLKKSLKPIDWDIKSNATESTRSKTVNLADEEPKITVSNLMKAIGIEYLLRNNLNSSEIFGSIPEMNRDFSEENERFTSTGINQKSIQFQLVKPCEEDFPGITEMHDEFKDWKWVYERTPDFKLSKGFKVDVRTPHSQDQHEVQRIIYTRSRTYVVLVKVKVIGGVITEVNVQMPSCCTGEEVNHNLECAQAVRGNKFSQETLEHIEHSFRELGEEHVETKETALNK